jgi:hypothetical protein
MKHQAGLSYVEVMLATLLIALTLVPMMESLQPGLQATAWHKRQSEIHFALRGQLETLLAEPFARLDTAATAAGAPTTPTAYSDLAATVPHQVYIWRYDIDDADGDGDEFTGGESDMLWISVATQDGSQIFATLLSPY